MNVPSKPQSVRTWTNVDTLVIAAFAMFAIWFLAGYLWPDPRFSNWEIRHSKEFATFLRFGWYAVSIAAAWFVPLSYIAIRLGKMPIRYLAFSLIGLSIFALTIYFPASVVYEEMSSLRRPLHPFTQLFPPQLDKAVEADICVAFLGGSTTGFADEDGNRWTDAVESSLKQEFAGSSVTILNQGAAWFTTQHSMINYQANVREHQPDVLVIMHAINDFMTNADHSYYSSGTFRPDYGHHLGPLARLEHGCSLLRFAGQVFRGMWYHSPRRELDVHDFPGASTFRRNLQRIVQLARLDGSKPVLMTQATMYKEKHTSEELGVLWMHTHNGVGPESYWNLSSARRGLQQYNAIIREVAHDEAVPLIDLEAKIPKSREFLSDDCHYTAAGMAIIAKQVTSAVQKLLDEHSPN